MIKALSSRPYSKLFLLLLPVLSCTPDPKVTLLNASYDPTRELYQEFNRVFSQHWKAQTGQSVQVLQSHSGSGKQARSVIDGLEADVVTLALAYDIDAIQVKGQLLPKDWRSALPNNGVPFTSTIVFLVRHGNPKKIHDWDDLVRPGIEVITSNPKTSGGARWNYLAAWGYALHHFDGDSLQARSFVAALYRNVPVLDAGARGSMTTFVQRRIGDVVISWENEALMLLKKSIGADMELVIPSLSIQTEPPVAVITEIAKKHGTEKVAKAYLEFLYSEQGQVIAAHHYFRPRLLKADNPLLIPFPQVALFTIDSVFGGWAKAQKMHFADGGIYDAICLERRTRE